MIVLTGKVSEIFLDHQKKARKKHFSPHIHPPHTKELT